MILKVLNVSMYKNTGNKKNMAPLKLPNCLQTWYLTITVIYYDRKVPFVTFYNYSMVQGLVIDLASRLFLWSYFCHNFPMFFSFLETNKIVNPYPVTIKPSNIRINQVPFLFFTICP